MCQTLAVSLMVGVRAEKRERRVVNTMRNTKHQAPNTKHQTPEKSQAPSSKARLHTRVGFGVWELELLWCLVFRMHLLSSNCLVSLLILNAWTSTTIRPFAWPVGNLTCSLTISRSRKAIARG